MSDGIKRRDFLKVLGVTGAGAGLVGCSTDKVNKLIPYVVPPEEITPGVATWYATACGECSAGCGVWVKTMEGRAVKLEGNPNHPVSGGALCARGHSALQGLYDPDRLTQPMRRSGDGFEPISWADAEALLARSWDARGRDPPPDGAHRVHPGRAHGPGAGAVGGRRVEYEALSEAPLREAARIAFGRDEIPTFDFEAADLVVSFGADFLETWGSPVEQSRGFARSSGVSDDGEKARFVFLGSRLSLTGQNADEWYPIRPGSRGPRGAGAGRGGGPGRRRMPAPTRTSWPPTTWPRPRRPPGFPASLEELADHLAAASSPLVLGPGRGRAASQRDGGEPRGAGPERRGRRRGADACGSPLR
jgi:anaerobic selenocysteine-containing dehydrogenase